MIPDKLVVVSGISCVGSSYISQDIALYCGDDASVLATATEAVRISLPRDNNNDCNKDIRSIRAVGNGVVRVIGDGVGPFVGCLVGDAD